MWRLSEPDIALNDRNEPFSDISKLVYSEAATRGAL